jgi:hypothetical protein
MDQPDSPLLALALGAACAAISYGCHRGLRAIEENKVMPLSPKLKGDKGVGIFRGVWLFKDKYQYQFARRSMLHLNLLLWKWALAFVAGLMAIYPLIYLTNFGTLNAPNP